MAFPSSPTNGQTFTEGGVTYVYNSTYGVWDIFDPNQALNAADVLTAIKTVDGAGSGLDADTLDGLSSGSFLRSTAKAADSNLLDGLDSSQFLRSDTAGIMTYNTAGAEMLRFANNTSGGYTQLGFQQNDTDGMHHRFYIKAYKSAAGSAAGKADLIVRGIGGSQTSDILRLEAGADALWQGNKIWTAGNDGSGSGLDADTVDGKHADELGGVTVATSDPAGTNGDLLYRSDQTSFKVYYNGWKVIKSFKDGLTQASAGDSGYQLVTDNPGMTSGTYWIKADGTNAIQMYVDATADDGGYDFYLCSGCTATSYATSANSCPAGTQMAAPRSPNWWSAAWTASGSNSAYFATMYVSKPAGGGNYTSCIMRHPASYGSGCNDWRPADGGRWWLRNSTYTEPNGDYSANGWLQNRNAGQGGTGDRTMNDGGTYSTGTAYLCSTNAKP